MTTLHHQRTFDSHPTLFSLQIIDTERIQGEPFTGASFQILFDGDLENFQRLVGSIDRKDQEHDKASVWTARPVDNT